MSCYKLICYTVKYKISKSEVIKCILLKLELLIRVSRYLLVKGTSVYKGVVSSLIKLYFRRVEHFVLCVLLKMVYWTETC
jgi:hypothetical protein